MMVLRAGDHPHVLLASGSVLSLKDDLLCRDRPPRPLVFPRQSFARTRHGGRAQGAAAGATVAQATAGSRTRRWPVPGSRRLFLGDAVLAVSPSWIRRRI
jgi:hypothetical protein